MAVLQKVRSFIRMFRGQEAGTSLPAVVERLAVVGLLPDTVRGTRVHRHAPHQRVVAFAHLVHHALELIHHGICDRQETISDMGWKRYLIPRGVSCKEKDFRCYLWKRERYFRQTDRQTD